MRAALLVLVLALAAGPAAALTDAQADWLARHAPLRFAPERDYGPFVFAGRDGAVDGLSVALLAEMQRHAGLPLQMLPPRPLAEVLAALRRRDADLVSALRPTPERAQYLLFTQPYVSVPAVLVVRADDAAATRLDGHAGLPVAVGAGYAVEPVVRARYPAVRWQAVPDDAEALRGVADGRYAAAVTDSASLAYIARRDGLDTLAAADRVGFDYTLSFAVRSDWPELRDILDEALRRIPAARRREIVARWVPPAESAAVEPWRAPVATRLAWALLALAVVLALAALLRARR